MERNKKLQLILNAYNLEDNMTSEEAIKQINELFLPPPIAYVFEGRICSKGELSGRTFYEGHSPEPIYKSAFSDVMLDLLKNVRERMAFTDSKAAYNRIDNTVKTLENGNNN